MNNQIFYNTIYFYSTDIKKTIVHDLKKNDIEKNKINKHFKKWVLKICFTNNMFYLRAYVYCSKGHNSDIKQ